MTASTTGRFVWHELHTTDRPKALAFYKQLLGWTSRDQPMGPGEPYSLCAMDGVELAGITKSMAPEHVPTHWLAYIAVQDTDAAVERVKELGGQIFMGPMDIPDVGRFAAVADPQGAAFAVFKSAHPEQPETTTPPLGTFCWQELMSTDPAAAAKFYGALFGYSVEEIDMGPMGTYRILKSGDRQRGGIMKAPPTMQWSAWLPYLHAKNVDDSTRNAKELGAEVHMPPMDIPNIGRFSVIADPTGGAAALFTGATK